MAKLGSFFRRLFTSLTSDNECSSSTIPDSRKSIIIIGPFTPPPPKLSQTDTAPAATQTFQLTANTTQSCSVTPRVIVKQRTIQIDGSGNENLKPNFLSSTTNKCCNRRLSAPLIIHASTHQYRPHRSAVVDETVEQALISPLQRLSLTSNTGNSVCHKNSITSLGTSPGSVSGSPNHDAHSSSLNLSSSNSNFLLNSLNHISPTSGR